MKGIAFRIVLTIAVLNRAMPSVSVRITAPIPSAYSTNWANDAKTPADANDAPTTAKNMGNVQLRDAKPYDRPNMK